MQYKNVKRGYNGYKIRKEDKKRIDNLKKGALIIGGIVIVICTASFLKSKSETNNNPTIEDINKYEEDNIIDLLNSAVAGFNTNDLRNINYDNIIVNQEIDNNITTNNVEIKELFIKYCNIYNVNTSIVYNKAAELTNNFTSEDFLNNNRIIGTTVCGKERVFPNIEAGIICFIRHVKQIPDDFNLISSELNLDQDYKTSEFYENEVSNYCDIFGGIEKELCMAVIYSENARDLSGKQFVNNNNPGCLRNSKGKMAYFENINQGMIEMILNLRYRYLEDMDLINCNYDELIDTLQLSYAPLSDPDNKDLRVNENWSKNVKSIYIELKDDYYSIYNTRKGFKIN